MSYLIQPEVIELRSQLEEVAIRMFSNDVWSFLTKDLQMLVVDALLLSEVFRRSSYRLDDRDNLFSGNFLELNATAVFYDHSFVLAPAYKFFEGYIYLVSIKMGILTVAEAKKTYVSIGGLTNIENLQKPNKFTQAFENVTVKINDKSVKTRWQSLYDTYSDFRNSPAHYGEKVFRNFEEVDLAQSSIFSAVKNVTLYFLDKKLIPLSIHSYIDTVFKIRQ